MEQSETSNQPGNTGVAPQSESAPPSAGVPPAPPYPPTAHDYPPPSGYGPPPGQGAPPGYGWTGWPGPGPSTPSPKSTGRRLTRIWHNAIAAWIVAGVLALTVAGLSVALASGNSGPTRAPSPFGRFSPSAGGSTAGPGFFGGIGGQGVVGIVASVGSGTFTVTDSAGATVTVNEQSSTTYDSGGASASASAVVTGARVLVEGTRNANTVTATRVVVLPAGGFGGSFSG